MTHTFEDDAIKIIPNHSAPYDTISKGKVGNSITINTSYKIPGGGIISDVEDMSRFIIALEQDKLIKPETWKLMTTEVKTNSGEKTYYGYWDFHLLMAYSFCLQLFGMVACNKVLLQQF